MENNVKYINLKEMYKEYMDDIEGSDASNSLPACQFEHSMLEKMYNLALSENRTEEIGYIQKRYGILSSKFKQFGILLKDLHETEKQD